MAYPIHHITYQSLQSLQREMAKKTTTTTRNLQPNMQLVIEQQIQNPTNSYYQHQTTHKHKHKHSRHV
jgi:hypothetical protein